MTLEQESSWPTPTSADSLAPASSVGEATDDRQLLAAVAWWTAERLDSDPVQQPPAPRSREPLQDAVRQALAHMSEGFVALDAEGRITFANVEAERLLGLGVPLVGRLLWEAAPALGTSDLQEACLRAGTGDSPVGFQVTVDQRWLCLRLIAVPGGLTVHLTDVTGARRREAETARAEGEAVERTARIATVTRALAAAVTGQDVVDAVTEHVRPLFGAAGISVWDRVGDDLILLGAAGYPPEFLKLVSTVPINANPPSHQALITGVPTYVCSAKEYISKYPALAELPRQGGKQAWAFLPLVTSGRTVGVLVISYAQPHTFSSEERTLCTALSGLVAQSLERGRLYDTEHSRARELQRGLLPHALPTVPAVTAAARYLPAGEGIEVGGDWYDVIPLSGDRVALVVGDVMGHGLPEAVTMGRLRTAVHTLADLELPPDEVFFHLNDLVSALGDDFCATCLYVVYDPTSGHCSMLSAGHPPPAVVHPDGTVRFPDLPLNPPLGAASPPFDSCSLELPPGSLLVLYTDGLLESPDRDLDVGMALMAEHLSAAPSLAEPNGTLAARLDAICDSLISAVQPVQRHGGDDTAVLIAGVHPIPPEDMACWPLPVDPQAAGQARRHIREQLGRWDLDDLVMTTELLVSELVGNVVRHAGGPVTLRLLRSRALICELTDGSPTMPRIRRAADTDEGGRGLQLIAALADRWGARYTPTGKCIWTEQLLHPGP
ncbi:SpoIIE family protein phosphatase [Streptomyces yaanensis]|uniref:SpoIIE family protein phosphatase n=1 Tax=Streptomyces yaanensis TaxID=1142239 RepID=A0ABV7S711_9ACTN|nr:SpoIIE family protein phosphatase [Streptomyces sp. CGMCC 4.7035]WNB99506.1 SpoIIE family protein phosphatase [Streptomyces sp. CGMCC 4.7035]